MTEHLALADRLERENEVARDFAFFRRWRALLDEVESLGCEGTTQIEQEYVDLFVLGGCPLHESSYVDPSGRLRGLVASEVERAYATAGTTLATPLGGELPDHVAFELEFLSLLCAEEGGAWRRRRRTQAQAWLSEEAAFLDEHLLRWLPRLAAKVRRAAGHGSFYAQVAAAAHAFVAHDRDLVEAFGSSPALSLVAQE